LVEAKKEEDDSGGVRRSIWKRPAGEETQSGGNGRQSLVESPVGKKRAKPRAKTKGIVTKRDHW
jgi:hypothetical protein